MAGYVIHVGHYSPQKVLVGHPDPKTGQPTGDALEVYKQNGAYQVINRARVWGRRVLPDGKMPENNTLEVNDIKYKGDIEFLKWGDNKQGAQAIEIRYLPMSNSLDYDYQRTVQKLDVKIEDGHDFIMLTPGENKFDDTRQALLVKMLRVHPQNRDSISKNPDPQLKGYTYIQVTDDNSDKTFVSKKEASLDAGLFVKGLSISPARLKNLLEIFIGYGVDFGEVNNLSTDTAIYQALLYFTEKAPDEMMKLISRYKSELLDKFELAKSFNALDLTKDGFIGMTSKNKPVIVWKDVEGKGNKMIDWVIDNFVKEDVYMQTKYFKSLCEELAK